MDDVKLLATPALRLPDMVVAFWGWPNAAEAATGVVDFLRRHLDAQPFAEITPDNFYDFSVSRPIGRTADGVLQDVTFPACNFYSYRRPEEDRRDLVLLLGVEPNLQWDSFIGQVLDAATMAGVGRVFLIGAYFDGSPHTRPVRLTGSATNEALRDELLRVGVEATDYVGPSSIHSTIMLHCRRRDLPAMSLWGRAPHYVQVANPNVSRAILETLSKLIDLPLDLGELETAGAEFNRHLEEAAAQNPEIAAYIRRLEQGYDDSVVLRPLQHEDILRSVEEFLRRRPPPDEAS